MGGVGLASLPLDQAWDDPAVRDAVDGMLRTARETAAGLMREHREGLLRLADRLQRDRYLDAAEAWAAFEGQDPPIRRPPRSDHVARVVGKRAVPPGI